MKYAFLIYEDEKNYGPERHGPALLDIMGKHQDFGRQIGAAMVSGAGLQGVAVATTVRTASGAKTTHDGPFAETKEQLGGFYVIEAPDLDAAIRIARQVPLVADGAIEIRPLLEPPS